MVPTLSSISTLLLVSVPALSLSTRVLIQFRLHLCHLRCRRFRCQHQPSCHLLCLLLLVCRSLHDHQQQRLRALLCCLPCSVCHLIRKHHSVWTVELIGPVTQHCSANNPQILSKSFSTRCILLKSLTHHIPSRCPRRRIDFDWRRQ